MDKKTLPCILGVSACLLGENTRYDGASSKDTRVVTILGNLFELAPICPEMAAGLPAPRPPVTLISDNATMTPRAIMQDGNRPDITDQLVSSAVAMVDQTAYVDGFVLKSKSPSCGIDDVKILTSRDAGQAMDSGIFARVLMERRPLVPMVNADTLADEKVMDYFVKRVFEFHQTGRLTGRQRSFA